MEEKKQPMPPQHPAHVLAKMEKSKQQKGKLKWLLPVAALVTVLVVALGIWIGSNSGPSYPSEPLPPDAWKTNILRSDEIPLDSDGYWVTGCNVYSVFGSDYQRNQISAVTFLDTLSGAPADAWDVSEAGDGSVMAWVEPKGKLYRLTIAGNGGVRAGTSCVDLFAGYEKMTRISFGGNFHTDAVQDMSNMFFACDSLTSLDLSSFDTAAVQDMNGMFTNCESLTSLDLRSFDTAAVQDMNYMFSWCESLTSLNLSSFDTAAVKDMSYMFYHCCSLTSLDLSSFDTAAVQDMSNMFYWCEALTSLDLSEKFVTTNADTGDMFCACPAGEKYPHLLNN
ncbi:MAG: BspA family leucine-rich repeat surface protein [Oscillospiraceae bacterium]|nr:BspA family leucine-rich repeat surface protein [Oscillospiraceae bacterium]